MPFPLTPEALARAREHADRCHDAVRAVADVATLPLVAADLREPFTVEPVVIDVPRVEVIGAAVGVVVAEIGGHVVTMEPAASNVTGNAREQAPPRIPGRGRVMSQPASQLPMFSGEPERELTHWEHVLEEHIKPGVAAVTLKEFAYRCDAKPSNMSDALAERDHKRIGAEQLIVLLRLLPEANRLGLLEAIAKPLGYRVERVITLTPAEEIKATRDYLAKMAPGLIAGLDKEVGRG